MTAPHEPVVTATFAGSGDAFGSGGRYQTCIHLQGPDGFDPVLLDCGATSLSALKRLGLDPGQIAAVLVTHLHGDHFGGLPFLILDGQFSRRTAPLTVAGPPGIARRLTEALECMFPGSSTTSRRFDVATVELVPGSTTTLAGVTVSAWEVDHPSGASPLALRVVLAGKTIAYTGDTAWTDVLIDVASGADLLIAEAYYWDKNIPYHLRHTDLHTHRDQLTAKRILVTHMSTDMLDHQDQACFEIAHDGLVIDLQGEVSPSNAHRGSPQTYVAPSVLVIDDVGLIPMGRPEATAFFQVVNRRYEVGHSTIVTTNRGLPEWGEISEILSSQRRSSTDSCTGRSSSTSKGRLGACESTRPSQQQPRRPRRRTEKGGTAPPQTHAQPA